MTIKLEVGKKYLDRSGEAVEIVRELIGQGFYKFQNPLCISYSIDGRLLKESETSLDLIEEVNESVKKPHKWAKELHAFADGDVIEWRDNFSDENPWRAMLDGNFYTEDRYEYRIKPQEVPQWRKDLAEKMRAGGVLEWRDANSGAWRKSEDWGWTVAHVLDPRVNMPNEKIYRIRPEPKPDVVKFFHVDKKHIVRETGQYYSHLKLIWDGETGVFKGAEVLK